MRSFNLRKFLNAPALGRIGIGKKGEKIAETFLKKRGMRILARNARFGHKEFDLVAKDDDFIVFVEVKTSRTDKYGDPSEWVTARKQRRLVQAAQLYMQKNRLVDVPVRFDVVTVKVADSETIVEYYPDAFPAG